MCDGPVAEPDARRRGHTATIMASRSNPPATATSVTRRVSCTDDDTLTGAFAPAAGSIVTGARPGSSTTSRTVNARCSWSSSCASTPATSTP